MKISMISNAHICQAQTCSSGEMRIGRRNDTVRREATACQSFSGLDTFYLEMSAGQNDVNYLRTRRSHLCIQQSQGHLTAPVTLNWAPVGCFYMRTKRLSMYTESSFGLHFKAMKSYEWLHMELYEFHMHMLGKMTLKTPHISSYVCGPPTGSTQVSEEEMERLARHEDMPFLIFPCLPFCPNWNPLNVQKGCPRLWVHGNYLQ